MAEPYVPELFVGRAEPMKDILDWAHEDNPAQRVLSVVGPPGVGKSYLLHGVRDSLQTFGQLVFWINLSRDEMIRGREHPDVVTDTGLRQWLKDAIKKSHDRCDRVRPYDSTISPEATLFTLATDLCERCDLNPILIVDGFEEIDQQRRDWLEESVLAQFIGRSCTRIIIGRRDEFSLNSPALRWTEGKLTLTVMNDLDSDLQVKTRLENWRKRPRHTQTTDYYPSADLIENFRARYPVLHYSWNHPGINTFLLERIVPRHQSGQDLYLTADDLHLCVTEVTSVNATPLSLPQMERLIALVLKLDERWDSVDLMDGLQIVIEDDDLAELFRRGIVYNLEGTALYRVAEGIREVVTAWQELPNIPTVTQEG